MHLSRSQETKPNNSCQELTSYMHRKAIQLFSSTKIWWVEIGLDWKLISDWLYYWLFIIILVAWLHCSVFGLILSFLFSHSPTHSPKWGALGRLQDSQKTRKYHEAYLVLSFASTTVGNEERRQFFVSKYLLKNISFLDRMKPNKSRCHLVW